MPEEYITVPIETNPDELAQVAYDRIEELVPGWEPHDGNFEVIVIEAIATMMAEGRDVASAVPLAIFRYFGQTIMKIPAIEAVPATALVDFKFSDTTGHTLPNETQIVIFNSQGEGFAFRTTSEAFVAEGGNEIKGIPVEALEPGAASSNIKGKIEQAGAMPFVESIIFNAATTETIGGTDAESDIEYLNRLSSRMSLIAPRPIVTRDFALIATDIPGIHRCLAINGYNPETLAEGQEKTVTLVPLDDKGKASSALVKEELKKFIEEHREVNFLPFVIDPTNQKVDVTITVHAVESANRAVVKLAVEEAIKSYLNPENWGLGPQGTAGTGIPIWRNEKFVRQGSIATVANQNVGVAYVTLPTLCIHGGVLKGEDLALTGAAPLPEAGTITVTVTSP